MPLEEMIQSFLGKQKRKRIRTETLESYLLKSLGKREYWQKGGYLTFVKAMNLLVDQGYIRPIKAWQENGKRPPLSNGYQILEKGVMENKDIERLLTFFHPGIKTTYFIKNQKEYQRYYPYLLALDQFLKEAQDFQKKPPLTLNERSFQIFSQEKWLGSREGSHFLQIISLSYEDLNCYPTYEPFFYYHKKEIGERVNSLIIENKDTFYSIKKLFLRGCYSFFSRDYNLLIYGEGNKITRSFSYYYELEHLQGLPASFYYFGDLDPAGISIWYRLTERMDQEVLPAVPFYQALLHHQREKIPSLKTRQRPLPREVEDAFLSFFPEEDKKILKDFLAKRRYLPQEGLHYQHLEELAHVDGRDDGGF